MECVRLQTSAKHGSDEERRDARGLLEELKKESDDRRGTYPVQEDEDRLGVIFPWDGRGPCRSPALYLFRGPTVPLSGKFQDIRGLTKPARCCQNPERRISWLFFNPVNTISELHPLIVPGHSLDVHIWRLGWAAALEKYLKFRANPYIIKFRQVKRPTFPTSELFFQPHPSLLARDIGEDWIGAVHDIETISRLCQSVLSVRLAFGESWNYDHLQLIVTAKESEEEVDPMEVVEEWDPVPESPLHAMNRRES